MGGKKGAGVDGNKWPDVGWGGGRKERGWCVVGGGLTCRGTVPKMMPGLMAHLPMGCYHRQGRCHRRCTFHRSWGTTAYEYAGGARRTGTSHTLNGGRRTRSMVLDPEA